jgi:hypothetical protein
MDITVIKWENIDMPANVTKMSIWFQLDTFSAYQFNIF